MCDVHRCCAAEARPSEPESFLRALVENAEPGVAVGEGRRRLQDELGHLHFRPGAEDSSKLSRHVEADAANALEKGVDAVERARLAQGVELERRVVKVAEAPRILLGLHRRSGVVSAYNRQDSGPDHDPVALRLEPVGADPKPFHRGALTDVDCGGLAASHAVGGQGQLLTGDGLGERLEFSGRQLRHVRRVGGDDDLGIGLAVVLDEIAGLEQPGGEQ